MNRYFIKYRDTFANDKICMTYVIAPNEGCAMDCIIGEVLECRVVEYDVAY